MTTKRFIMFVWAVLLLLQSVHVWAKDADGQKPRYDWRQTDSSLALLNNGRVVWQFNFDPTQPKPYFHPVCLTDGAELTWHRPPDHPWHYGLWFSWKYINGLNYWEEDRKTGLSEGRTEIKNVKVTTNSSSYSAAIAMQLSYHPPGRLEVLAESCQIRIGKPDDDGTYRIDWTSHFTAAGPHADTGRAGRPKLGRLRGPFGARREECHRLVPDRQRRTKGPPGTRPKSPLDELRRPGR